MTYSFIHTWNPFLTKRVGGIETFLKDLIGSLSTNSEVEVLSWEEICFPFKCPEATDRSSNSGNRIMPDVLKFGINLIFSRRLWRSSKNTFVLQRPELIFILRTLMPNCKIVLFLHTDQLANSESATDSLWRKIRKYYSIYIPMCYKRADYIYTFSKKSLPFISQFNGNCFPVSASVNEMFKSDYSDYRQGILWVGRLEYPKNPILASRVLVELSKLGHKVRMIGEGSLFSEVALIVNGHFEVETFVTQEELAEIMRRTKYLILTSNFEGSPRTLVEALVSGCLILLNQDSDPDEMRHDFEDRIFEVRETRVENYVEKINELEEIVYSRDPLFDNRIRGLLNLERMENLSKSLKELKFGAG